MYKPLVGAWSALCLLLIPLASAEILEQRDAIRQFNDAHRAELGVQGVQIEFGGGYEDSASLSPIDRLKPSDEQCLLDQVEEFRKAGRTPPRHIRVVVDPRWHGLPDSEYHGFGPRDYERSHGYYESEQIEEYMTVGINRWGDCRLFRLSEAALARNAGVPVLPVAPGAQPGSPEESLMALEKAPSRDERLDRKPASEPGLSRGTSGMPAPAP